MAIVHKFTSACLESVRTGSIVLAALTPIREALAGSGVVDCLAGDAQPIEDAWLYLVPFTYVFRFEWRDGAFERYEFYAEYLSGEGEIHLNGRLIRAFDAGELRVDVTKYLEEQNELKLVFKPFVPESPTKSYDCGIYGDVFLRASNFITLDNFRVAPEGRGCVRASVRLTAHCAGRYDFIYAFSRGGTFIKRLVFSEKLRALPSELSHELPSESAGPADDFALRLTIERGGVACDEWDGALALPDEHSTLCALMAEALYKSAFNPACARDMGLYIAKYGGREPSLSPKALTCGFILQSGGAYEPAAWPGIPGPLGAEMLDMTLSGALTGGRRALLLRAPTADDARSFAYQKLKSRLRAPHAFVDRAEGSALRSCQSQTFEIWFAGDERARYPLSVSAVVYDPEGRALKSCAFSAYADNITKLGEMRLDVPESLSFAVVRVLTTGYTGGESVIQDAFFARGGLSGLSLPPAKLEREGDCVKNASGILSAIMVRGKGWGFYGALLPGESAYAPRDPSVEIVGPNGETLDV